MRILDGARALGDVELHLTDTEADRLIDEVAALRHDLAHVGMSESHGRLTSDDRDAEVTVYVYKTAAELAAEVTDRMRNHSPARSRDITQHSRKRGITLFSLAAQPVKGESGAAPASGGVRNAGRAENLDSQPGRMRS